MLPAFPLTQSSPACRASDAYLDTCGRPEAQWFAVRVRARSEIRVSGVLECKGYESFAPTYRPQAERLATRAKAPKRALFPGYVFCRFSPRELLPIVTTPDVQSIVSIGPRPEPVSEREMDSIRRGVELGSGVQPHPYLAIGQRVRVQWGALAGIEGVLVQSRGAQRLVIAADLLQRAVSLQIDRDCVAPL